MSGTPSARSPTAPMGSIARAPTGSTWGRAAWEIARKEAIQLVRTKRLIVLGSILLASLLFTTIVVPILILELNEAESDPFGEGNASENFAFLFFLNAPVIGGVFLLQILAVVLTSDGVCSEWQRRTVFLVLSKPVPRTAFVMGKFLGAALPLVAVFGLTFLLDYLLLQALLPGSPTATDVGRFFGAIGMVSLGMMAFAAMGLFFSTLTRNSTPSLVLGLAMAVLVFPIASSISDYACMAAEDCGGGFFGGGGENDALRYDISHYFTPAAPFNVASDILVEEEISFTFNFLFPVSAAESIAGAALAGVAWTGLFIGGSLLVVQRRDFE